MLCQIRLRLCFNKSTTNFVHSRLTFTSARSGGRGLSASGRAAMACDGAKPAAQADWRSLGTPEEELRLEYTLPTGQSFRWRETGQDEYTGVIGQRVVKLRQLDDDVVWQVVAKGPDATGTDEEALRGYFNLATKLADLTPLWVAACPHFARVQPLFPGARMLRQDPVETLFQFLCSSNNHISRIQGMIERLCARWGSLLLISSSENGDNQEANDDGNDATTSKEQAFYAFPTLEQLSAVTEADLRDAGFGYRAKFVTGTVMALHEKGGVSWLHDLRGRPTEEVVPALCTLPGVGPKVAACVALFGLDAHAAIPVDVHVWNLACKYYTPHLRKKTLGPAVHAEVQQAFVKRFGAYAGWAHNTLFVSDLARFRHKLTEGLSPKSDKTGSSAMQEGSVSKKRALSEMDDAALAPYTPPLDDDSMGLRPVTNNT